MASYIKNSFGKLRELLTCRRGWRCRSGRAHFWSSCARLCSCLCRSWSWRGHWRISRLWASARRGWRRRPARRCPSAARRSCRRSAARASWTCATWARGRAARPPAPPRASPGSGSTGPGYPPGSRRPSSSRCPGTRRSCPGGTSIRWNRYDCPFSLERFCNLDFHVSLLINRVEWNKSKGFRHLVSELVAIESS